MGKYYDEYLAHYGVKGMRWGVLSSQTSTIGKKIRSKIMTTKRNEAAYREKLKLATRTAKKGGLSTADDAKFMEFRNQSLAKRAARMVASEAARKLLLDVAMGKVGDYATLSKRQVMGKVGSVAAKAAANLLLKDKLAASVAKRYNNAGEHTKKLPKNGRSPEANIDAAAEIARAAIFVGGFLVAAKVNSSAATERPFVDFGKGLDTGNIIDATWKN